MIKNIIFDVGNVLVNFRPVEVMQDLHFPQEVIDSLYENMVMSSLWNELDLSIRPMNEVFEDMINLVPEYKEYSRQFFKQLDDICVSYDYSREFVKSFKDRGYKTFVLSNYSDELWTMHEKDTFTFLPYLDGKIVSGFVHLIKPDEAIYKLLLETYDLKAEECVFFDDREENIIAAKKIGINGIVFNGKDEAMMEFEQLLGEESGK